MMENRYLSLVQVLQFAILVFLLKTGQCAPKNSATVTEQLDYTKDTPKNYLPFRKLVNESKTPKKYISVRRQLGNDESEAPNKYMPVRMQNSVNDITVPRKYISFLSQQNETYQNINRNASKKHTYVKRQFDSRDYFIPRRHSSIRRQEEEGGGEDSEQKDSDSKDSGTIDVSPSDTGDDDTSGTTEPDASGLDADDSGSEADDSGSKADYENVDDTDSRDSKESYTTKPEWPTITWTEIMVMFRKEAQPEKLHLNVGKDNIFRLIGKALESSRETELELLKLKELLKKLRHKLGGNDGGGHSDVNININAASPLGITGDVSDRKSSMGRDYFRDILHSNYARSPAGELSFDDGINDEMMEAEKRLFIRKGAQFLRNAWDQYNMRKHHQLYERSDENHKLNKEKKKMLDSEKREYITKGVAFLHKAWEQYKLKKYHHL